MPVDTDKIRRLREKMGLSQSEAAARAGMRNRQNWYALESGRQDNPTLRMLEKVADALGVTARDLLK